MHHLNTLFTRIAGGDEKAFEEVFYLYSPRIRHYIANMLREETIAEEITQDVFLQLWLQKEKLASIDNPSAWLYRISYNRFLNHIRDATHKAHLLVELNHHSQKEEALVEEQVNVKYLKRILQQGVQQLPAQRRLIYCMSKEQHLSRKQIAEQLNISENAVRNQLASALQFLREYIVKHTGVYLPLVLISHFLH